MASIYDGQICVGSIDPDNGHGIVAYAVDGRIIGCYPTSTEAVAHVLRHYRNPPPPPAEPDTDAELAAVAEAL